MAKNTSKAVSAKLAEEIVQAAEAQAANNADSIETAASVQEEAAVAAEVEQAPVTDAAATFPRRFKIVIYHDKKKFEPGRPYDLTQAEIDELEAFLVKEN